MSLLMNSTFLPSRIPGKIRYFRRPVFQITPKDTIVSADFSNNTGDALLDDTLKPEVNCGCQAIALKAPVNEGKGHVTPVRQAKGPWGRTHTGCEADIKGHAGTASA